MSNFTHAAEGTRKLPTVLTVQQQEAVIWTAVGILIAAKNTLPKPDDFARLTASLRSFGLLTVPDQQASMLLANAANEWAELLDLAPWA